VTPFQPNDFNKLEENQTVTPDCDVTDENQDNQLNLFDCHGVTGELEGAQGNEGICKCKAEKWETGAI
jgi:hypothetical protein